MEGKVTSFNGAIVESIVVTVVASANCWTLRTMTKTERPQMMMRKMIQMVLQTLPTSRLR
jgi:hypothetical protein